MKESYELQGLSLQNLQRANARIEAEKDQYLEIFRKHNLDKLALVKPGLIETRVNNGTKAVFEDIENDSKDISNLDSDNIAISGCSLLGTKQVEIVTKPVKIDIIQPTLPREIKLIYKLQNGT